MLPIILAAAIAAAPFPFPETPPKELFGDTGETVTTYETLKVLEWYASQYDALRAYAVKLTDQRDDAIVNWKAEKQFREQIQSQLFWKDMAIVGVGSAFLLTAGGFITYAIIHR